MSSINTASIFLVILTVLLGATAAEDLGVKGIVALPQGGRVVMKLQIRGPEINVARDPGTEANRGTYEEVEVVPRVFLQLERDPRHCVTTPAPGGEFLFEGLSPGNYEITIAVPGLGSMGKSIRLARGLAGSDGYQMLNFDFESPVRMVEPLRRAEVSGQAATRFERGAAKFGEGSLSEARVEFDQAVSIDPHYAEAWEYLGIIHRREGNLKEAENCFRKALQIDPNSYWALEYLGTILMSNGDVDQARELFERAVLLRPDDPYPRTQLGKIFFELQELSAARGQLVKARALDPRHFTQPQLSSAEVFRILKDRDSVAAELDDFIKNFPDDPKVPAVRRVLESIPWQ